MNGHNFRMQVDTAKADSNFRLIIIAKNLANSKDKVQKSKILCLQAAWKHSIQG